MMAKNGYLQKKLNTYMIKNKFSKIYGVEV